MPGRSCTDLTFRSGDPQTVGEHAGGSGRSTAGPSCFTFGALKVGMAEPLSEIALEMNDISMRFGDVWVLNDVDLKLPPGAIHAIVGHNGAGKSTLMKIALGVYQPTRGEVRIGGRRLTYNRPAAARELGLGMVFQERSLIPTLNGLDNLFLNSEHLNRFR